MLCIDVSYVWIIELNIMWCSDHNAHYTDSLYETNIHHTRYLYIVVVVNSISVNHPV